MDTNNKNEKLIYKDLFFKIKGSYKSIAFLFEKICVNSWLKISEV